MVLQFRLKVTFVTLKHKRKEEGGKGKKTRNSELVKAKEKRREQQGTYFSNDLHFPGTAIKR